MKRSAHSRASQTSADFLIGVLSKGGTKVRLGYGTYSQKPDPARIARAVTEAFGPTTRQIRKLKIRDLRLSVRARKGLDKLHIRTLGHLMLHSESQLLGVSGFGPKSLEEVKKLLKKYRSRLKKVECSGP